jgi:hypothetical protein
LHDFPDNRFGSEALVDIIKIVEREKEALRNGLSENSIQTSAHYPPVHKFSFYAETDHELPYREDFY